MKGKIMKLRTIFYGLTSGLLLGLSSCSLNYEPLDTYSDVTEGVTSDGTKIVFKDKAAVESHLTTLYNQMRDRQEHWYVDLLLISDSHSDNAYAGTTGAEVVPFENNSIEGSNSVLERDWNRYLEDVARANKLICNIDLVTDAKMRNTKESILEAQFTSGAGNWCTWMFGRDLVNWNNNFTWAKWVTPSRDLISAFKQEGDEVRFKESIVYYDCNWSNYYPSDNYPFMYKCRSANSSIIKYRYADVLLLKAEALIMQDTPDLEGAADIIDEVRDRAKLGALPTSVRSNKNVLLNALLKERRLELAFEGQRWFDLVRLDKVEEVMNAVYSKDSGRKAQIYTFDKNSYRLPIPQSVIDANDKIHQNPGY